ncbi:hypothetical protein [Demequina sp. NBRC 110053]|uniref:hypothetical protein n=1 Tax=Demequina sp. NBRC 110053 TaxID=1570342 RepID=UPI001185F675|nr:hypothetical protein [Demequina sp. NBRC 110053]
MRALGVAVALSGVVLAGCAAAGNGPAGPIDWDEELDLGTPGEVVHTVAGVEYYPACGNETLIAGDTTYYPFTPANTWDFPQSEASGVALSAIPGDANLGFARASALRPSHLRTVVAPEPGDDTGTLVVYANGFAHWSSDNGELATWLTTTEIEYAWVC